MTILFAKYTPNLYIIDNYVIDLNRLGYLAVLPESYSTRYYVWVRALNLEYNLQIFCDTKRKAENLHNKIMVAAKINKLRDRN